MPGLNRALSAVEDVLAAGTLAAAALIAFLAIVLRGIFGIFLFWSEEAIIYLVIFSTYLGAVITLRHQEHVNVDIIAAFLGRRGKQVMALVAITVTLAYLVVVGYFAWMLLFEPFSSSTTTPAMHLPLWTVELAVPIGFTLMFLRAVELLVRVLRSGAVEEDVLETEAEAVGLDVESLRRVQRDLAERGDDHGTGRSEP
jgi:C4-dicarboxylate transporter DctQ subunit